MVATRRRRNSNSRSGSRKNKSKHSYIMRGCSGSGSRRSCNHYHSNKHNFFAKGMDAKMKTQGKIHGKLSSKKCKCACHLNKHNVPECRCNCNQTSKVFGGGTTRGGTSGGGMCMKGGDALNLSLAYTGKQVPLSPSPYAAYVGKGGNNNASVSNAYPKVNDTGEKLGWLNSSQTIRGGGMSGPGTSYANGLVGSSWSSNPETWSGVNGVGGGGNHLSLNTYNNDVSRQMLDIGANYPFNGMLSGGRRGRSSHRCGPDCGPGCKCGRGRGRGGRSSHRCGPDCGPGCKCGRGRGPSRSSKYNGNHKKTYRGGGILPQNLVNVGRNFMYNIGASNNAMNGYDAPSRPMPYQDQLVSDPSKFLKYI